MFFIVIVKNAFVTPFFGTLLSIVYRDNFKKKNNKIKNM